MIRLALLRHGHTSWNRQGRIQGRTDVPLDSDAVAQLSKLVLPAPWRNAQLCASPLERARETARLISGRAPRTEPALMEMNWGEWEGKRGIDLQTDPASGFRDIEQWGWSYCPPNGESPADLRERLVPWVHALASDTVAVCHIGVMRVLLAHASGWDFDGPAPFQIKRNRLYVLGIEADSWALQPSPLKLEAHSS
ncbi:histidine phosphatase family protein [uncultured Roseobacter sp.]|uniref:histidine phosphatase family protein n=1 Tax=uncultured Roseobacter sp. TaxID=114847 RepID=UPI0026042599|nr:histidine phosphatase family protein [uncultured Roseobacter sp.]